jgi:hypothetical protein
LITGFIGHTLVTTNKYDSLTELHIPKISVTIRCYGNPKFSNDNDRSHVYKTLCVHKDLWSLVCLFTCFVPQISINDRTVSAGTMLPLSAVSREDSDRGRLPSCPERTPLNGL